MQIVHSEWVHYELSRRPSEGAGRQCGLEPGSGAGKQLHERGAEILTTALRSHALTRLKCDLCLISPVLTAAPLVFPISVMHYAERALLQFVISNGEVFRSRIFSELLSPGQNTKFKLSSTFCIKLEVSLSETKPNQSND